MCYTVGWSGGYSTLVWVWVSSPKGWKWGFVERIGTLGLLNCFFFVLFCFVFWQKCCFQKLTFSPNEAFWTGVWLIFRLKNWKFTQFRHLMKFLWFFLVKMGVLWNWKMLKRGSCGMAEGAWKGGLLCRTSS